ncbi:hypothetical protein D3C73_1455400 [compost metagenome]
MFIVYSYPLLSAPGYPGYTFFTSGLDFPIAALATNLSSTYTFTSFIPAWLIAHPLTFIFPLVFKLAVGSSIFISGFTLVNSTFLV